MATNSSGRGIEDDGARARAVLRAEQVALTDRARAYVVDFLAAAGYAPGGLRDDELRAIFLLLSRAEEYETLKRRGGKNWEPAFASLERRTEIAAPVIERSLEAWEREGRVERLGTHAPPWPDGKRFCLCLTHDVDLLAVHPWRERLRSLPHFLDAPLAQKGFALASLSKNVALRAKSIARSRNFPVEPWLEAEAEFGFRSTWLFMADPKPAPRRADGFYRYDDPVDFEGRRMPIRDLIAAVAARGWDVGLHGSLASHEDAEILRIERAAVERAAGAPITSTRQHHLCFDIRRTPRVQAAAGLTADSTLGSNLRSAYRAGTAFPFLLYDLLADEPLPVLEIPLIVQETGLVFDLDGDEELILRHCTELLDRTAERGGVITMLWHNNYAPNSLEHRCYRRVLKEAAARGAWGCSMAELESLWRARLPSRTSADGAS